MYLGKNNKVTNDKLSSYTVLIMNSKLSVQQALRKNMAHRMTTFYLDFSFLAGKWDNLEHFVQCIIVIKNL